MRSLVLALLVLVAACTHAEKSGHEALTSTETAHAQKEWAGAVDSQRRDAHDASCAEFNTDLARAIATNLTDVDCTLELVTNVTRRTAFTNFQKVCHSADVEPSATRCGREGVVWKLRRLGRKYKGRKWLSLCQAGDAGMTAADVLAFHSMWVEAICVKNGNEYCHAEAGVWARTDSVLEPGPKKLNCACSTCLEHTIKAARAYIRPGHAPPEGAFDPDLLTAACKRAGPNKNRFCWLDMFQPAGFLYELKVKLGISEPSMNKAFNPTDGGMDGNVGMDNNMGGGNTMGSGMDGNMGGMGGAGMDNGMGGMGGGMDNGMGGGGTMGGMNAPPMGGGMEGSMGPPPMGGDLPSEETDLRGCTKAQAPRPSAAVPKDIGEALCQDSCVSGVLPAAVALETAEGGADAVRLLKAVPLLHAGCARNSGQYCANAFLAAGVPAQIDTMAAQCELRDATTGALKPVPGACPSGCEAALASLGTALGCCAGSLAEFGGEMGGLMKGVAGVCGVEVPEQCAWPGPLRFKLRVANLLFAYADDNADELAPLAAEDVLAALDEEGVVTCDLEALGSGDGTRLSCEIVAASKEEAQRMKAQLAGGGARRRLLQEVEVELNAMAAAVPTTAFVDPDAGLAGTVDQTSIVDETDTIVGDEAAAVEPTPAPTPDPDDSSIDPEESTAWRGMARSWVGMGVAGLLALAAVLHAA